MTVTQTYIMYAFVILSSTACIWLSELIYGREFLLLRIKKNIKISFCRSLFITLALLILIVPLVQRSCGADTNVYYYDYSHDRIHDFDMMFSYLLVFLHRYIKDPQVGLGCVSALTVIVSVFSLLCMRKKINVTLAFFAYVTCIYFYSYNYIRMLFALSFVFVGYSLCLEKKEKIAIVPFAFAALFHFSAIIVLIIHIVLMSFKKYWSILFLFGIMGLAVFLVMPYRFLSLIAVERYSTQIVLDGFSSQLGIGTIIRSLPILYFFYRYHKEYKNDNRYTWLLFFAIANVFASFLGYFVGTASRISNILLVFHIIYAIPFFVKEDVVVKRKNGFEVLFVLYCIGMYYIMSHNFRTMDIVPYY